MKKLFFIVPVLFLFGCSLLNGEDKSGDETAAPSTEDAVNVEESEETGIKITSPQANSVISFPLTITGEAKGPWYFEASFTVRLVDSDGTVLAETYAQALDDWMQEGFVAFEAKIEDADPNTSNGKLVFEKVNMSGLPENDFSVEVPVKFGVAIPEEVVAEVKDITVTGTDFKFTPSSIELDAGENVKIVFKNNGSAPHDFQIEELGLATKVIGSGDTTTLEFTAPKTGTYTTYCSVAGHREAGMEGSLVIK